MENFHFCAVFTCLWNKLKDSAGTKVKENKITTGNAFNVLTPGVH